MAKYLHDILAIKKQVARLSEYTMISYEFSGSKIILNTQLNDIAV